MEQTISSISRYRDQRTGCKTSIIIDADKVEITVKRCYDAVFMQRQIHHFAYLYSYSTSPCVEMNFTDGTLVRLIIHLQKCDLDVSSDPILVVEYRGKDALDYSTLYTHADQGLLLRLVKVLRENNIRER